MTQPLPDGSPPSIGLRSGALEALQCLRVDWNEGTGLAKLKESQLGKHIFSMARTDSVPGIRKAAEHLMEQWSRPVFSINDDYRTLQKLQQQQQEEEAKRGAGAAGHASGDQLRVAQLAKARQEEIDALVKAARLKPNTRARLWGGDMQMRVPEGALKRPEPKKDRRGTNDSDAHHKAQAVMASMHYEDATLKNVGAAKRK